MKIIKIIIYFIFWIIDLTVPEELSLKIINHSKNKFRNFSSIETTLL